MKKHNEKGFTIAELLIVVAIIGVLVAIGIPIFTSQLKKAREAVCMANRRSLKAELSADYMSGANEADYKVGATVTIDANSKFSCKCSEGGTISYVLTSNHVFEVYCSKHAPSGLTAADMENIYKVLEENRWTDQAIDSGAKDSTNNYTSKFIDALKACNIDLEALGATSWRYSNSGGSMLEWTTQDISKMNPGDSVVIMRCRFNYQNGKNVYTVWRANVESYTHPGTGKTYNIIKTTSTQLTKDTDDKTNLDAIKQIYDKNNQD